MISNETALQVVTVNESFISNPTFDLTIEDHGGKIAITHYSRGEATLLPGAAYAIVVNQVGIDKGAVALLDGDVLAITRNESFVQQSTNPSQDDLDSLVKMVQQVGVEAQRAIKADLGQNPLDYDFSLLNVTKTGQVIGFDLAGNQVNLATQDVVDAVDGLSQITTLIGRVTTLENKVALNEAAVSRIDGELAGKQDTLTFTPLRTTDKNVADGVAGLDASGKLIKALASAAMTNSIIYSSDVSTVDIESDQYPDSFFIAEYTGKHMNLYGVWEKTKRRIFSNALETQYKEGDADFWALYLLPEIGKVVTTNPYDLLDMATGLRSGVQFNQTYSAFDRRFPATQAFGKTIWHDGQKWVDSDGNTLFGGVNVSDSLVCFDGSSAYFWKNSSLLKFDAVDSAAYTTITFGETFPVGGKLSGTKDRVGSIPKLYWTTGDKIYRSENQSDFFPAGVSPVVTYLLADLKIIDEVYPGKLGGKVPYRYTQFVSFDPMTFDTIGFKTLGGENIPFTFSGDLQAIVDAGKDSDLHVEMQYIGEDPVSGETLWGVVEYYPDPVVATKWYYTYTILNESDWSVRHTITHDHWDTIYAYPTTPGGAMIFDRTLFHSFGGKRTTILSGSAVDYNLISNMPDFSRNEVILPRLEALESDSHAHANKIILDTITTENILSVDDRNRLIHDLPDIAEELALSNPDQQAFNIAFPGEPGGVDQVSKALRLLLLNVSGIPPIELDAKNIAISGDLKTAAELTWAADAPFDTVEKTLTSLVLQAGGNRSDIGTNSAGISSLDSRTSAVETKTTANEGAISALDTRVGATESDNTTQANEIVALANQIAANDVDITNLQNVDTVMGGRLDSAESDIASLAAGHVSIMRPTGPVDLDALTVGTHLIYGHSSTITFTGTTRNKIGPYLVSDYKIFGGYAAMFLEVKADNSVYSPVRTLIFEEEDRSRFTDFNIRVKQYSDLTMEFIYQTADGGSQSINLADPFTGDFHTNRTWLDGDVVHLENSFAPGMVTVAVNGENIHYLPKGRGATFTRMAGKWVSSTNIESTLPFSSASHETLDLTVNQFEGKRFHIINDKTNDSNQWKVNINLGAGLTMPLGPGHTFKCEYTGGKWRWDKSQVLCVYRVTGANYVRTKLFADGSANIDCMHHDTLSPGTYTIGLGTTLPNFYMRGISSAMSSNSNSNNNNIELTVHAWNQSSVTITLRAESGVSRFGFALRGDWTELID